MTTTTVTVLGSADAFNSAGRGNAGYLVEDAEGAFCVDFGPTALMALKALGFAPDDLDAVFVTHLHGDHFGGLQQLLIDAQYCHARRRPLTIGGPLGTGKRVEAWYKLAYGSAAGRRSFATRYLEWAPGDVGLAVGRQIRTFRANHMATREGALCLRIKSGKAVLAFTGDTGWFDEMPVLAKGADLFVCECTDDRTAIDTHLSWEMLAPRFSQLEAKRILLTHFSDAMRRKIKQLAAPRVSFADDGMVVRLRRRS